MRIKSALIIINLWFLNHLPGNPGVPLKLIRRFSIRQYLSCNTKMDLSGQPPGNSDTTLTPCPDTLDLLIRTEPRAFHVHVMNPQSWTCGLFLAWVYIQYCFLTLKQWQWVPPHLNWWAHYLSKRFKNSLRSWLISVRVWHTTANLRKLEQDPRKPDARAGKAMIQRIPTQFIFHWCCKLETPGKTLMSAHFWSNVEAKVSCRDKSRPSSCQQKTEPREEALVNTASLNRSRICL